MGLNREKEEGIQRGEGEIYQKIVLDAPDLNKIKMEVNVLDYTIKGVSSMEYEDR